MKNGTYAVVQCKTKFWVSLCQTTAFYNKSGSGIALPRSRKIQQKRQSYLVPNEDEEKLICNTKTSLAFQSN